MFYMGRRPGGVLASIFATLLFTQTLTPALARPAQADARRTGGFELTIDNIMRGPGLVGHAPRAVRWSGDGERVFFEWKQADEPLEKEFDTYVVNRDGTALRKLTEQEAKEAPPRGGDESRDRQLTTFVDDGDLFIYDHVAGRRRQLTSTTDGESNPRFTHDQRRVSFTRSGNLFVLSLDTGSLVQLTDIRPAAQGAGAPAARGGGEQRRGTDSQEHLKKEERELIDSVRRRAEKREADEKKREEGKRKPFSLGARQSVSSLQLSPDEKYVIAGIAERGDGAKSTIVPNYVTESAYTEDLPARTKVGDAQSRTKLAVIGVESGEVKWVEHGIKAEKAAEADPDAGPQARDRSQSDREVTLLQPVWSDDGERAVLLARSSDNKDRWVMALDPASAKTRIIATDTDEAWIGGPGMFALGWLGDNRTVYFQSERTGYSHLYTAAYDGGQPQALTSGRWEVTSLQLSNDKSRFFLTTSEEHYGERHFYSVAVTGGARTKLTSMTGASQTTLSPDERWMAFIHSYSNRPPELYIGEARLEATSVKVTSSPAPEFSNYNWIDPPIVEFAARDGVKVPARLYKPRNFRRGGPAVIFVHGAGYLQNVHRWWSNYYREYMFHHLLMERGYVVLDIDYRASAGHGRAWRTAIYRHMGGKDLDDQVDGARWLVSEHGVGVRRIGIYGGSYGGFITLMAMFTQPDVFAAGASLRPVTDWAHYNHPYTSNILNEPQKDSEAYKRSSPIYFAEGLKGALLICHGMVDVNVHFQDTVRLVQRLIELRKENWELAVYPVEDHGFVEPTSWADEYRRILKLFSDNLGQSSGASAGGSRR